MDKVASNIKDAIFNSTLDVASLIGVTLIIGFILKFLGDEALKNRCRVNYKLGTNLFGYIGTPVHELSHALVALLFGHKIKEIVFFKPVSNNSTQDGQALGYVNHAYNKNNIYHRIGNFFIGVAPIYGGIGATYLLLFLFLPDTFHKLTKMVDKAVTHNYHYTEASFYSFYYDSAVVVFHSIFNSTNFSNPSFYLFLYLVLAVVAHIRLSGADLKGASDGVIALFVLSFVLNLISVLLGGTSTFFRAITYQANLFLIMIALVVLVLMLVVFALSLAIRLLARR